VGSFRCEARIFLVKTGILSGSDKMLFHLTKSSKNLGDKNSWGCLDSWIKEPMKWRKEDSKQSVTLIRCLMVAQIALQAAGLLWIFTKRA